jgi:hypothetical protein
MMVAEGVVKAAEAFCQATGLPIRLFVLFVDACVLGFARLGSHGFGDAFVGDALWSGALSGCCPGERTIEPVHIHLALAALSFQGGVHGGQKLRP